MAFVFQIGIGVTPGDSACAMIEERIESQKGCSAVCMERGRLILMTLRRERPEGAAPKSVSIFLFCVLKRRSAPWEKPST